MSAIRCQQLCKTFSQGNSNVIGLDKVSLTVESGDFVCLSGPSGSGKTTLLNAIGGLDVPDSGEVFIGCDCITKLTQARLADIRLHKIGFIFQAYNLIPVLTARENVEFVMQVQGVPSKERRIRALRALADVELKGVENRLPSQLSGGQQQRVAVARAIVANPEVVLADEPTANLDSKTADQLLQLFSALNVSHNATFIVATHDQRVMAYARHLVYMQDGNVVDEKTT